LIKLPTTLGGWKDIFELLSYVTVVLGLPAAIVQYRRSKLREQADREYGTYNALDEKYMEFQRICFDHPELDIFDIADANPQALDEEKRKQELISFTMLISIFERAYLMYHDQSNKVKAAQWTGWDEYIRSYAERANFRNAWEVSGETFDRNFENYVEGIMEGSTRTAAVPQLSDSDVRATTAVRRVNSVADPEYLSGLRLVSQYGWAGGSFNTNELSYLIETPTPVRTSAGFVLVRERKVIGIAVASCVSSARLIILHEMIVSQSVTRDEMFMHFGAQLFPVLTALFPSADVITAEIPHNEPRHLKAEVFARGLSAAGFSPALWPYYLPSGFNHRSLPQPGQLYIKGAETLSTSHYLGIVHTLYDSLYRPLWQRLAADPTAFDREIRDLEAKINTGAARPLF